MDSKTLDGIIKENGRRLRVLKRTYDPVKGSVGTVKRCKLHINSSEYMFIPKSMSGLPQIKEVMLAGSVESYAIAMQIKSSALLNDIIHLRIEHDFEYWCAMCVKVQDKQTKKLTPFILRPAQLKLLKAMLTELEHNRPIRIILLKARQWGGSTLVQIFMAWIQLFHREGWHSVIVADIEDQSRNIKAMYSRLAANHPKEICSVVFSPFEGSTKNKIIVGRNCIIYLGSMQKPDALRSADVMMAHLSEVGLWHSTDGKKPEDVVQSIAGTVPLEPFSVIVMESTAKGVGNFFHRQWCKAVDGQSGYVPVFVAWYEIEIYSKPFASAAERREFASTMSLKERSYFELGATLEAINWYRNKQYMDSYDNWRMGCEFPTTPIEAFQSTGGRAHNPNYVASMRKYTCPPLKIGDMFAECAFGKNAINNSLAFAEVSGGNLWLWAEPEATPTLSNRYIVSMDIGGRNPHADWSVISVIDRYFLTDGGVEECIGTCRFHLDQDLAVWKAVQIARYFNNALLVIEANSLNPKGSEGDHTLTILDEIKGVYSNLYCRTDPQRIREGAPERYGFFTSAASKTDLINQMNKRLREEGYIERDSRALDEADCYEIKENGSYGAIEGGHDDIYMSRAIGLKASQTAPLPALIKTKSPLHSRGSDLVLSESSF